MTSLYPTEVSPFKLRATGIAIFRTLDAGFGLLASFAMAYAMADLGWSFYFINAAWDFVFLIIAYFIFVETKGLKLEEIDAKFEGKDFIEGVDSAHGSQIGEDPERDMKDGGVVTQTAKG